jgi:thioredoxin reductase (NADPH)
MSTIDTRREQMFPKLTPGEIARVRHFGGIRRYAAGAQLFKTCEPSPGVFVIVSGTVAISRRDGLGHVVPIIELGAGDVLAEVGQLSGQPALIDGAAKTDLEAILIPTDVLRALLGERMMRALILRRVALIETGSGGPIGPATSSDVIRLHGFFTRNGYSHQVLDPAEDAEAKALIERYAPEPAHLPLAVCPDGTMLKNPSEGELARWLGMVRVDAPDRTYDVAIVGAGPARLSAAVYAASEGLSVIVFDASLLDRSGFVRTGPSLSPDELAMNARLPMLLESNIFGVFASGDVRRGSVKWVGRAICEGAAVVPQLHTFLVHTPVAPQGGPEISHP